MSLKCRLINWGNSPVLCYRCLGSRHNNFCYYKRDAAIMYRFLVQQRGVIFRGGFMRHLPGLVLAINLIVFLTVPGLSLAQSLPKAADLVEDPMALVLKWVEFPVGPFPPQGGADTWTIDECSKYIDRKCGIFLDVAASVSRDGKECSGTCEGLSWD